VPPTIFVHIDAVTDTPVLALRGVPAPIVFGAHYIPDIGLVVGLAVPVLLSLLGGVVGQTLVVSASHGRVVLL
jgi:hypothetical protein